MKTEDKILLVGTVNFKELEGKAAEASAAVLEDESKAADFRRILITDKLMAEQARVAAVLVVAGEGKNAEERKAKADAALASDEAYKEACEKVAETELDIANAESEIKEHMREYNLAMRALSVRTALLTFLSDGGS